MSIFGSMSMQGFSQQTNAFGQRTSAFGNSCTIPQPQLMTLKVAKQQIGSFMKIRFFITCVQGTESKQNSDVYNIGNLATASFHFTYNSFSLISNILIQRHNLAKDKTIQVKVTCQEPCYNTEWVCADDDNLREIGEIKCDTKCGTANIYLLEVQIYVSQLDSLFVKLYEDDEFTDFKLSTDEGSVEVHRACLAVHSEVFKAMLGREWKETTSGHLTVKEVSLQTLQDLKRFMYLGTLPDQGLRPLLLLAMCYLMDNLKTQCVMKLAQTVTAEDLYSLLEFAFQNKIPDLTFAILTILPEDVLQSAQQIMNTKEIKTEPET